MLLQSVAFNPFLPGVIAAVLYLTGAFLQARTLAHSAKMSMRVLSALAAPAIVLHALAVYAQLKGPEGLNLGLFKVISLTTWIMVVLVWLMSLAQPVRSLLVVLFPLSAIAIALSLFAPKAAAVRLDMADLGLAAHVCASILAYSILMMAALQSIFVGVVERNIRTPSHFPLLRVLPALETMERLLFTMVWVGFAALTLAIGSGFFYLEDIFAQHVVHHTVLSTASWLAYVLLLAGRLWFGWRGLSAVRWTVIAFVLLLLGYLGSKFVMEVLLERG